MILASVIKEFGKIIRLSVLFSLWVVGGGWWVQVSCEVEALSAQLCWLEFELGLRRVIIERRDTTTQIRYCSIIT